MASIIDKLKSIRGMANSIVGLCQFIKYNYPDDVKRDLVIALSNKMVKMYEENKEINGIGLSLCLLRQRNITTRFIKCVRDLSNETYLSVAFESMIFRIKSISQWHIKPYR
jgi:hypothetical protein